ncbi:PLP-dependent aminotransferase family protein [Mesorhizobium sp. dw_380]|uniref:MocR-like pyridoxine biosynthesis transcription factor PdxR n=1 Tax=Mesorhizobium sp. dw_380 TaxID=2812001 RepID=UPI001BDEB0DA|nr:PLP-dependent aminotransferase family protein [Mesorhizobium sp. dw_380]
MARRQDLITIASLRSFDRTSGRIGQQFTQALRDAIAKGELKPGQRLPSTRALSAALGMARGTIVEAFDQLYAEGYIQARARSGTVVASVHEAAPEALSRELTPDTLAGELPLPTNVARLAAVSKALTPQGTQPFAIAHPGGDVAPDDKWRRLGNRVRATRPAAPSGYIDPRGLPELRSAIAEYVRKARAVKCSAEQVIITAGTQQGLFLAATVLLASGDAVWAEDPAYPGIEAVLGNFSITACRVPVDGQGIDVKEAILRCPGARAAFVTPSHQYPLGMPMSMPRRTSLLSWARNNNAWVVEDDYDSELRYAGYPFPSLQGLDPSRVVYLGTMSKMLFSSLRLGYAIVPVPLIDAFAGARAMIDRHSPTPDQHVLASYMREGLFEAHVRRIRGVYAERRAALIEAIEQELPSWATLQPSDQGMHLVLWLPLGIDDVKVAEEARSAGLVVRPISPMFANPPARSGLMLGFGGFTPAELRAAVRRLKDVLAGAIRGPLTTHLSAEA